MTRTPSAAPATRERMILVARYLRSISEWRIDKTWDDYFGPNPHRFTTYDALCFMQEQCPNTRPEALSDAVADVIPELFAEYWGALAMAEEAIAA